MATLPLEVGGGWDGAPVVDLGREPPLPLDQAQGRDAGNGVGALGVAARPGGGAAVEDGDLVGGRLLQQRLLPPRVSKPLFLSAQGPRTEKKGIERPKTLIFRFVASSRIPATKLKNRANIWGASKRASLCAGRFCGFAGRTVDDEHFVDELGRLALH